MFHRGVVLAGLAVFRRQIRNVVPPTTLSGVVEKYNDACAPSIIFNLGYEQGIIARGELASVDSQR